MTKGNSRGGCLGPLLIVVVFAGGIIFLVVNAILNPAGVETAAPPGDARNFDPFGALPGIMEFAGKNARLVSMDVYYVRSDGTMDLNAPYTPKPFANYEFVTELDKAPENAPPPGAGGSNAGQWYQPVTIRVFEPGQWRTRTSGSSKTTWMHKGMDRSTGSPTSDPRATIPMPKCSAQGLWREALKKDAPANAVAIIRYDGDGYEFSIQGLSIRLEFDQDCNLTRSS